MQNFYRIKFQYVELKDTNDTNEHLKAWQRPEVIFQFLHSIYKEYLTNELNLLQLLKKKKRKFESILEFGCAIAPITTSLFEFYKLKKSTKIFISDIQTIHFHYAAFKFRKCSNVTPILLTPENDFLLKLKDNVDVIFCKTVFEHLNKPFETAKLFHKYPNPGGLLFFDFRRSAYRGLDTHHSAREREDILNFILNNFEVIFGKISVSKSMDMTIARKL